MLQSMRDKYPQNKIKMLAVFKSSISNDVLKEIYANQWGIHSIPAYFDTTTKMFEDFAIRAVPYAVVIDKSGNVVDTFTGFDHNSTEILATAFDKVVGSNADPSNADSSGGCNSGVSGLLLGLIPFMCVAKKIHLKTHKPFRVNKNKKGG